MPQTRELAEQILAIAKQSWAADATKHAELSHTEFLALEYLAHQGTATVGQIRKKINVLAAQMSRILRSLEEAKFVTCAINPQDKRKVDVTISKAGRKSFEAFREAKLGNIIQSLERLTSEERSQFLVLLHKMMSQPSEERASGE